MTSAFREPCPSAAAAPPTDAAKIEKGVRERMNAKAVVVV
jgi:hypothetical protein